VSAYNVRVPHNLGLSEEELRRKGQQDGALTRRGGKWHIYFRQLTTDADGNTVWAKTSRVVGPATGPEALTKREAKRLGYDRFVAKANGMTITPGGLVTVQEFYDRHYDPEHLGSLSKGSQYAFRSLWRKHLLPSLGKCNLADVNQRLVQTVITAKGNAGRGQGRRAGVHLPRPAPHRADGRRPAHDHGRVDAASGAHQPTDLGQLYAPGYRTDAAAT
jgi:hypothetical protein